jgi:hypothetical protein
MRLILMIGFLFLKTGEKFATQETAGPTVAGLTTYLGEYEPRVFNDPGKAVEYCASGKPGVGIVTPAFYLTYGKQLGMEPVLETKREGVAAERYILVALKDASDDLHGKTIATPLAAERRYVTGVILQDKLGDEVRLKATMDVEGAVFDLVEKAAGASDAVLMEEGAWKLFEGDSELGPKLKVIYRSDELPRDLVVKFGGFEAGKVLEKLKAMTADEAGQKVLRSIRVEAFVDIDQDRLAKARKRFHGK